MKMKNGIESHKYHSNDTNKNNTSKENSSNSDSLMFCLITKCDDNNNKENKNQMDSGTDPINDDVKANINY